MHAIEALGLAAYKSQTLSTPWLRKNKMSKAELKLVNMAELVKLICTIGVSSNNKSGLKSRGASNTV